MNNVQEYVNAFRRGYLGDASTAGLLGRVIRGRSAKDFATLSEDPDRKLILLTDPDGLAVLPGLPGFSILLRIGWEPGYAIQKIQDGYSVKLVVFREGGPARLADWDGMFEVVGRAYPDIAARLRRHRRTLESRSFAAFEQEYGHDMSVVDKAGKKNPAFMTIERYRDADDTAVNARAFLYFTIHLREQYSGDGYTYDDKGVRGMREYIAPNCPLSDLIDVEIVDFDVELPAACRPQLAGRSANGRPLPGYYDPADVGKFYLPRFDLVEEAARTAKLPPAAADKIKAMLVGIDYQTDFVLPEIKGNDGKAIQKAGALQVPGAVDDLRRFIELIYTRPERFSALLFSLDQHLPWQIFFRRWWQDRNGQPPQPYTQVLEDMVKNGEIRPRLERAESTAYPADLNASNQTPLMIWPDHCGIGTPGAALMPALVEAIYWWSIARQGQPIFLFKGTVPTTEHYGIFSPCIKRPKHPQGGLNTAMLDMIAAYDEIMIAGEAEDFCVKESMQQLLGYFGQNHPQALKKVSFLKDCTSMVFPNNRTQADEFLADMAGRGIQIITTDALTGAKPKTKRT